MGAIGLVVRTRRRRRTVATVIVTLMIAVVIGAVLAALAGARRTDAALPAFERSTDAADMVAIFVPQAFGGTASTDLRPEVRAIESVPGVTRAAAFSNAIVRALDPHAPDDQRDLLAWIGYDADGIAAIGRPKVVAGRLADDHVADELVIDEELARDAHLSVGSRYDLQAFRASQIEQVFDEGARPEGLHLEMRVVGIVRQPTDLRDLQLAENGANNIYEGGQYTLYLTSAFWERSGHDVAGYNPSVGFWSAHPAAARDAVERSVGGPTVLLVSAHEFRDGEGSIAAVQRSISLQSRAMQAFAIAAALAGLVLIIQTLGRQLVINATDDEVLRAVGVSDRQLALVALVDASLMIAAGTTLGIGLAWLASASLPFPGSAGQRALLHPGHEFDTTALLGGGFALGVALIVCALVPFWLQRRRPTDGPAGQTVGGRVASRLRPTLATGVRFAVEPGRGRSSVPVRSALVTGAAAVTALLATSVFSWSLADARSTPQRYGVNWDLSVGGYSTPAAADHGLAQLEHIDGIEHIAGLNTNDYELNGLSIHIEFLKQERGVVDPVITEGRAPRREGEVALGAQVLRKAHLRVGDEAALGGEPVTIVGEAVLNAAGIESSLSPGRGGVVDWSELDALVSKDEAAFLAPQVYLVAISPGADPAAVTREVRAAFSNLTATAIEPADISNLADVASLPGLLAAMVAVLGLGTMVHALVSLVRRRRRELGVLKALGFTGSQLRRVLIAQSVTMSAICILIGLPLGITAGRLAWGTAAHQLAIVVHPVVKPGLVLAAATGFIGLAMLVGLAPAQRASHVPAAEAVRAD